ELQRRSHAGARAIRSDIVVELREGSEDALHQLPRRRVVDRLCGGPQRDSQGLQVRAQREVVVLLAGEARQVENDDELHLAFVRSAVLQKPLQLRAVRGLRALTLFPEPLEDLEALAVAVLLAGPELRGQAQILGLPGVRD